MDMDSPRLDPDIAEFLRQVSAAGAPPITAGTVAEARANNAAFLESMRGPAPEMASVEDVRIPAPHGEIPARRYTPPGEVHGVIGYFHGGGWVLGDLEGHDAFCRHLARRARCTVVNIGYRLAPEHRFPAAVDDCFLATEWLAENSGGLPIVLAGDSSGGNLAAAVALRARDEQGPRIGLQVLLYPVLDHDLTTDSYRRCATGYLLTRDDMAWFWDQYVPEQARRSDPYASPLRAASVADVAPALIVVAGFDPLRDEAVAYARRLEEAGVPVTLIEYAGMIHGFMTLNKVTPVAEQATERVAEEIRKRIAVS